MKILVYGAGSIGSLYAALLKRSGQDVTLLARGQRLAEVRARGIRLEDAETGALYDVQVDVTERLADDDAYELVLVVLPRHHVSEVLPILRAGRAAPSVMFFGNNASGPDEMVEALGRSRVLLGFPGAAAVRRDDRLRYLVLSPREQPTTIGEVDGSSSPRVTAIADVLRAAGFPTAVCSDMDAWLKTHVAEIGPTAGALYMADLDPGRLARTPDALVLMLRAIREGYRVLTALGVPITPAHHRIFQWLPEPLLLLVTRRRLRSDPDNVRIGHASGARDEMQALADEFRTLASSASVSTPALDRLNSHLDPSSEAMPEGSAEIPVHWGVAWAFGVAVLVEWAMRRHRARPAARNGSR